MIMRAKTDTQGSVLSSEIPHDEAFRIANNYLGWGERRAAKQGALWFIGLEEAKEWTEADLQLYQNCGQGDSVGEPFENGAKGIHTGVTSYCSKIASSLSRDYSGKDWRLYRDERLWRKGSGIIHLNLFPIGRASLSVHPGTVKLLFGYDRSNWHEYEQRVKSSDRFTRIREIWEAEPSQQAVVCFGKKGWCHTDAIFRLRPEEKRGSDGTYWVHEKNRIIQTGFFGYQHMRAVWAEEIAEILKGWGVRLP